MPKKLRGKTVKKRGERDLQLTFAGAVRILPPFYSSQKIGEDKRIVTVEVKTEQFTTGKTGKGQQLF